MGTGWRSLAMAAALAGSAVWPAGGPGLLPEAPPAAGTVFVLSGPSGTGKSTLARRLVRQVPGLVFAVSHTTRPPRPGERHGVDYFFVDDAAFDALLAQGRFLEWVRTYGHRYGLGRGWLDSQLAAGKDVLMDLDSDGARAVRAALPGAVMVLLLPPSAQELARRLRDRHTESAGQQEARLGQARRELARFQDYDYLVVNGTVDQASRELEAIVTAARARRERRAALARAILAGFPPPTGAVR
jgi:guanylate kinase